MALRFNFTANRCITYGEQRTVVRVTDRGPYAGDRNLDLSQAAAEEIGLTAAGADTVDVRVLTDSGGYGDASRKKYGIRKERDEGAALLLERPYLRVLGAHSHRTQDRRPVPARRPR